MGTFPPKEPPEIDFRSIGRRLFYPPVVETIFVTDAYFLTTAAVDIVY
jgi:hypothetical protein